MPFKCLPKLLFWQALLKTSGFKFPPQTQTKTLVKGSEKMEQDTFRVEYLLKIITDKIKIKADTDFKKHNLTLTQSKVLAFLESKNGTATQKEIETFLKCSHPTVVGIVSRMEQNGFLKTSLDFSDKRNKNVSTTEKAKIIHLEIEKVIAQTNKTMLLGFSEKQKKELNDYLLTIYNNLNGTSI